MKSFGRINLLLLLAVVALAVAPLALGLGSGEEPFTGADALAEEAIVADHPDYEPWFSSIYEPPSGEIESALFALQAALGAGFLGYYFGVARTRQRLRDERTATGDTAAD
ncbi:energy-coupling factor ABC transporter substrate-binding protein [Micromonospora craterilacus]|uniref:Cobalt transport protein CbiN n=1 Tax=Micromonospora craterilacus TaxID=1655439 RepID=A0A2W2EEM8_9ACTN|nr:energy-coupling factor ABC transporter substrate-binding protein [Micromonospora craterilacus]PZG20883.1 energy-coupling factor ABC transporter substrate-binding protein [Micromonospora craterilacus]